MSDYDRPAKLKIDGEPVSDGIQRHVDWLAKRSNPLGPLPEWSTWARPLVITGWDQFGAVKTETVPPPRPDYYFWLGKDAYPDWPVITRIICE